MVILPLRFALCDFALAFLKMKFQFTPILLEVKRCYICSKKTEMPYVILLLLTSSTPRYAYVKKKDNFQKARAKSQKAKRRRHTKQGQKRQSP
jgi:hypothetical protein